MTDTLKNEDLANNENNDKIITLLTKTGEKIDFLGIAGISYNGKNYAILQPKNSIFGMKDDEALVFKVTLNLEGEDKYEIVLDDDIVDAVFEIYNKSLQEN